MEHEGQWHDGGTGPTPAIHEHSDDIIMFKDNTAPVQHHGEGQLQLLTV